MGKNSSLALQRVCRNAETADRLQSEERPPRSSAVTNGGVSRVKGIEWCSLHNLGGTAAFAVPYRVVKLHLFFGFNRTK